MTHADMIRQNGGKIMICNDCIYSLSDGEIKNGNINVICTCNSKEITITNGDMKCSNYEERK